MSDPALHRLTTTAWILLGAAICAWMIPLEPNLLEEGIALHLAQRIVQGERLFSDLASFTGPLPFELLALLFRAFGDDVWVARGAVALMHGLACGALYALARAARDDGFAHLAVAFLVAAPVLLFPLFSLYFYSLIALHLAIGAAWAAGRGVHSPRHAVLAGALVAATALCKQNVGLALAAALALALVALAPAGRRQRAAVAYAAGGAAIALATVALYFLRGDLLPLWRSLVTLPLSFTSTFDSPYVNLWPPGEFRDDIFIDRGRYVPRLYGLRFSIFEGISFTTALSTQLLYASPFIGLALTVAAAFARRLPTATWVHAALLVALVPSLFPRTDWGHLVYLLPAAAAQLCLVARPLREPRPMVWVTAALVVALATATASIGGWLHDRAGPARFGPRLPLQPVSEMLRAPALGRVIAALRTRAAPGEPIFVARAEPLVYFATGTSNPTPYSGVIPGIREEQERTITEALRHVRYAVMSDIDQPLFVYYSDELPGVWAHLERHFRVARGAPPGWLTLLERGEDRGPTAVDLFDRRELGRAWVRRGDGSLGEPAEPAPRLAARLNRRPLAFWLDERGGGIDFDLTLPDDALFQSSVALWQTIGLTSPYEHPRDVHVVVSLRREGKSFQQLARRRVLEGRSQSHGWLPLEADLSRWSGENVTLRLEVRSDHTIGRGRLGWFGSPRVALRAKR